MEKPAPPVPTKQAPPPQPERPSPPVPTRKAPAPPSSVDYGPQVDETIEKLKAQMGKYAESFEFEKCPPLREVMQQLTQKRNGDASEIEPLLQRAESLLP
jgi:hypothetical protein